MSVQAPFAYGGKHGYSSGDACPLGFVSLFSRGPVPGLLRT